jgi:uncharacterized phage protein (TIGR02218 family)
MSKTLSAGLRTVLQSETMETATCMLLELTRFTPEITGITQANPGVVTTDIPHGYASGDTIIIRGGDMVEVDDHSLVVTVLTTTTFEIDEDTNGHTAYTTGAVSNQLIGFTDHDQDITYDKVAYEGDGGYTPSATVNSGDLAVDNLDVYGLIDSIKVSEADILSGKYDYCRLWLFLLDYTNVALDTGTIKYGRIGEASLQRDLFTAEFRGLSQALSQDTISHYMPPCYATVGDDSCQVDLTAAANNDSGSITTLVSQRKFRDTSIGEADGWWSGGILHWTSGNNAGREMEIKLHLLSDAAEGNEPTLELLEGEFGALQIGDAYTMTVGCDKSMATCKDKFANVVNYRGFPHLPGLSELLNYGNRKTEIN